MSDVTIVMTTWIPPGKQGQERLKAEEICLMSWREHLINKDAIHLHIADDGSLDDDMYQIMKMARENWDLGEITYSQQDRNGVGASLNAGLKKAFERSPIVLHAVDDWELLDDLWLTPWADFIEDKTYYAAAVRFFPHPDLTGIVKHIPPYGWAIELDRHHFDFGLRPSLWHKRLFDTYGWFKEGCSAIQSEADFNQRINSEPNDTEKIWLALPELWRPRETGSLSELTPS